MVASKKSWLGLVWSFILRHWLVLLLSISGLIRLSTLAREGYWYDESFTALITTLSPANALAAIAGDVHPPLWYLLEWLIARVAGNGPFALRLPSAIFGLLAIYQTYLLMVKLDLKRYAPLAVGLLSVMPAQIYYSQEARGYQLLNWLVLFAICAVLDRRWLRAMLAFSLLMYVHNLAFLYVAPLGLWALWRSKGALFRFLPVGLSFLPWLVTEARQAAHIASGFWITPPGLGSVFIDLMYVTAFARVPAFAQVHVCIITVFLSASGLWLLRRQKSILTLGTIALLPVVLMYVVSIVWKPISLERAVLPSGTLITILWAVALGTVKKPRAGLLALAGAPVLLLAIAGQYLYSKADYHDLTSLIDTHYQPGDVLYHATIPSTIFLQDKFPEIPQYVLPNVGDLNQALTDETKLAMGIKQREIAVSQIRELGYRRMWLLRVITPAANLDHLNTIDHIIRRYPVLMTYRAIDQPFAKLDVYLLDLTHVTVGQVRERRIW